MANRSSITDCGSETGATTGVAAAAPSDNSQYFWVNTSFSVTSGSAFAQLDKSVAGEWIAPEPGTHGGELMAVKQKYCK
jgi:hypothetical protein